MNVPLYGMNFSENLSLALKRFELVLPVPFLLVYKTSIDLCREALCQPFGSFSLVIL